MKKTFTKDSEILVNNNSAFCVYSFFKNTTPIILFDQSYLDEKDQLDGFVEELDELDLELDSQIQDYYYWKTYADSHKKVKCTCGLHAVDPNYAPWQHYDKCPCYKSKKECENEDKNSNE